MPANLALVAGLALLSGEFDAAVGGRAEVNGGIAPVDAAGNSGAMVGMEIVPIAGIQYREARHSLRLLATPRIFARVPNILGIERPLFLGRLDLTHSHQITRRLEWNGSAGGLVGELDYTALGSVFGGDQTTAPPANVLNYAGANISQGASIRLARRHSLDIFVDGFYGTYLGADDEEGAALLPTTISAQGGLGYSAEASRRDRLTLLAAGSWQSFTPGLAILSATGRFAWEHRVAEDAQVEVAAGALVPLSTEITEAGPTTIETPPPAVLPDAEIGLSGTLRQTGESRITGGVRVYATPRTDGIRGALYPILGTALNLGVELPPDWRVGVNLGFATAATSGPDVIALPGQNNDDQTVVTGALPVSYLLSRDMALNFGARGSIRMSHLRDTDFGTSRPELLFFVSFSGAYARRGDGLRWVN